MVAASHKSVVAKDGTFSIPEDILTEIGAKPGDAVWVTVDDQRVVRIRRLMTIDELKSSIPALDRDVDPDFGNIIRESQDEWAERKMRRSGLKA